jgi:TrmH family RNA methyltransferase
MPEMVSRPAAVVLVRPENPENIGLAARAMKNTGFSELRLAGIGRLSPRAYRTAVHAREILDRAKLFPTIEEATADLQFIAASTAKRRRIIPRLEWNEAAGRIGALPAATRVGLLFGNERTGLTGSELGRANLVFTIPQALRQPSYNLGAAVLLTLYTLFVRGREGRPAPLPEQDTILPRRGQDETIDRILVKLSERGFIHRTNRNHVSAWARDYFGRTAMTIRDRGFLLALFDKNLKE